MVLERHLLPSLKNGQLTEIDAGDLLAIIDPIKAKGRVQEARHVLILAKSVLAHAVARQKITRNSARDIPMKVMGAARQRDRYLKVDELKKFLEALGRATFLGRFGS